jgi:hypothetical protein
MTNREKNENKIMEILFKTGVHPALTNKGLTECCHNCKSCLYHIEEEICDKAFVHWCEEEVPEIDWSRVPIDTKVLVSDSESGPWRAAHFAKPLSGLVVVFNFGKTSWTALEDNTFSTYRFADIPDQEERGKYLKDE